MKIALCGAKNAIFLKCFKSLYNDVRGLETSLGTQTRVREAFLTHILTLRALLKNRKKM